MLLAIALALGVITFLAVLWTVRGLQKLNEANVQQPTAAWAISEWRTHGAHVFKIHPHHTEAWRIWLELESFADRDARRRVCSWCSSTNHGTHVKGTTFVGSVAHDGNFNHWYCSRKCFRSGHSYEQ